jgi:gas vesicle protein
MGITFPRPALAGQTKKEEKMIRLDWEKKGNTIYMYDFNEWYNITHQTWADWVQEMIEKWGPNTKLVNKGKITTLKDEMEHISYLKKFEEFER